jgi:hypothetical protein
LYRRRDNGNTVTVRGQTLDNRWVVPYNPTLLLEFEAHINVEICSSVRAVKYLYKYVYKGHDRATVEIAHDEMQGTYLLPRHFGGFNNMNFTARLLTL